MMARKPAPMIDRISPDDASAAANLANTKHVRPTLSTNQPAVFESQGTLMRPK